MANKLHKWINRILDQMEMSIDTREELIRMRDTNRIDSDRVYDLFHLCNYDIDMSSLSSTELLEYRNVMVASLENLSKLLDLKENLD